MTWLHEHGLIGSYQDYLDLPLRVLMDARMIMHHESVARQAQESSRTASNRRRR